MPVPCERALSGRSPLASSGLGAAAGALISKGGGEARRPDYVDRQDRDYDDFTKRHASFVADCRRKAKAGGKELHKLQAQIAKGEGAGASKSGRKQAPGCT